MDLLNPPLPRISLHPDIPPSEFFGRCEVIAADLGFRIYRGEEYAEDGFDQLNVYMREQPEKLTILMAVTPATKATVTCEVLANWKTHPPTYDEYVAAAKEASKPLLASYAAKYGRRFRLGISRRPEPWDRASIDCSRLDYAHGKFTEAVRSMAAGPGDIRSRLKSAFMALYVVKPTELPPPLQRHLEWVFQQLTWRPPRYGREGSLHATLARMKRATGVRIAKRILAITDALDELCPQNRR